MAGIYWLASYPKSGNTWLRVFLANYLRDDPAPVGINALQIMPNASGRKLFDWWSGIESSDLTPAEIERDRPRVYARMAAAGDAPLYLKLHDAFRRTGEGLPLFPPEITAGVLYVMRNPLDVVVSMAHHFGTELETAVRQLNDPSFAIAVSRSRLRHQVPQKLGSWSDHARSWIDESGLAVHVARYEEMQREPERAFGAIVAAAGLEPDDERLARALAASRFERLQEQERAEGFVERPATGTPFFREGRMGGWRGLLVEQQVRAVIDAHGEMMRRFGYLDERGALTD